MNAADVADRVVVFVTARVSCKANGFTLLPGCCQVSSNVFRVQLRVYSQVLVAVPIDNALWDDGVPRRGAKAPDVTPYITSLVPRPIGTTTDLWRDREKAEKTDGRGKKPLCGQD